MMNSLLSQDTPQPRHSTLEGCVYIAHRKWHGLPPRSRGRNDKDLTLIPKGQDDTLCDQQRTPYGVPAAHCETCTQQVVI